MYSALGLARLMVFKLMFGLLPNLHFFLQYKNFTKTNYLRLHLQTTGLRNKDDNPGKQEPMTIPKGHYIKH